MIKTIKDIFWHPIRKRLVVSNHNKVLRFWHPIIESYYKGDIEKYDLDRKNKDVPINKVIWQYWGQGVESNNLPRVVKIAMSSVDKYKGDYTVIRLDDSNIKDYIDLPQFVYEKLRNNTAFNRTFFSDLLRLALISTYGGVWLDATVLLSDTFPKAYTDSEFFMFQRSKSLEHKDYWERSYTAYWGGRVQVLNAIIFGKAGSIVIKQSLDLIMHYWETQDEIVDYFFMQLMFRCIIEDRLSKDNCDIVDDSLPHLLHTYINGNNPRWIDLDEVFKKCSIHKLTYFTDEEMDTLEKIIADRNII